MMNSSNTNTAISALLTGFPVRVKTRSRLFSGKVWEIYRSPYGSHIGSRVVDDEGRVHHFKVDAPDVSLEILDGR